MSPLHVAGIQFDIAWENPSENFRRVEPLAASAVASGAQLLVLPEMFATGFSMNGPKVAEYGQTIQTGLSDLARRQGVWVLGGYGKAATDPTGKPFNSCSLYQPDGKACLHYQKLHPFTLGDESNHYQPGQSLSTAEVHGVRVTPLICYDLRFPEPFRAAAQGTDLFVVIANWPDPRIAAWSTLLRARAIENQAYVLGVNRVGEVDGLSHSGCSALVDPMGETLASVAQQSASFGGPVDRERVSTIRSTFGFLADRRPQVYDQL
ncbi:MAG: carbon-nitrogen family hydrolase [Deltaproteobacteria bacterium]|nr:carbon-nitrogen family hydrolase [Deltaproteobacteria bacterium]